jgi:hypothetical protein
VGASSTDLAASATSRTSASSSGSVSAAGLREVQASPKKEMDLTNPWNRFQPDFAGQGFSKQTLSKLYQFQKKKKEH